MTTGARAGSSTGDVDAAGIRHDLRHGLATLQALFTVAQNGAGSRGEDVRHLLTTATTEIGYALELLGALTDPPGQPALPETARTDGRRSGCDATAVIRDAVGVVDPASRRISVETSAPLRVAMSPTHLARVIRNLLGNALGAAGPDGRVLVRAQVLDAVGGSRPQHARIEVHDDGPGPGPAGFSRPGGLGLSVVRSLVLSSGGWLVLGRSPIGGACAAVTLPLQAHGSGA